jgi:Uma2 family endonuclease
MDLPTSLETEVVDPDEAEILASFRALPTEDDLPCDDGEPMETPRHREQMNLLIDSLKVHWADRTGYYVGGNMFVHYDPENKRRSRGPDFFLVLNVVDRERKSWVAWQEGMRFPDVIIELLSDTTRAVDKGEKKALYEGLFRTAEYYLYDPWSQEFIGYHLHGMHYHEVELDAEQKIYSAATGLYLGVREGWLRWLTVEGAVVPTPLELAEQEKLRAEQAERQAEQEKLRAEQAERQAEQEKLRAEQTEQRAEQAEQLVAMYRRRFGDLGGRGEQEQ